MKKRVVITGLGCISPVGNDVSTLWQSLLAGRHGFGPITKFDTSELKVKVAEVKDFAPEAYLEKTDIRKTDLYAQYAIAAASQAVEESKIVGAVEPERLGVYMSSGIGGIGTLITETEKMLTKGPGRVSPFFIPMMIANMGAALIAIRCDARGPVLPIVTACATSTHSIGEAFHAIQHGYADAIIAGGAEAPINALAVAGFANCMALSKSNDPDTCCTPFDKRRSGFVMGEGAAALVLEEYEHAKKRGAKIYCEISGYSNTCDAYHMTAPHPEALGCTAMIKNIFIDSDRVPDKNMYINPHGTSTPLNDKVETAAIKAALGELAYQIPISSTKSMTGHMLGAAGAIEAIASIKTLETGMIPPTIGYAEFDPDCDLDYVPAQMRKAPITKALSLSLGFGGHNAGVLFNKIEE